MFRFFSHEFVDDFFERGLSGDQGPQICRCPYVLNISNSSLSSVIILSGCVYKNPVHVITLKIFQFYRAAACCLELRVHPLGNLSSQCNNKFEQVQNLKI